LRHFIDIHTHHTVSPTGTTIVRSLWQDWNTVDDGSYCSIGLHPWFLEGWKDRMSDLVARAANAEVIAIGECGLDRMCPTDFAEQIQAFGAQISLAEDLQKPLVIHCVRAWDEVFRMLKPVRVPVIFHGFNKGPAVLEEICAGGYYVSFGAALLNPASNAAKHLPYVPAGQFFLETDEAAHDIEEIYEAAALLRKCTVDDVILQIESNFHTVFKK
jgi:TatD DNase family protein